MSDNEDIVSSISKGCFSFKPDADLPKSPRKKKKSKIKKSQCDPVDYYKELRDETKHDRDSRYILYLECWESLESQVKRVQDSLNESIFNDMLSYVKAVHANEGQSRELTEIPTAALVTGINIPDHHVFFSTFVTKLKERVTPHVVQLQSKVCTNLQFLIKSAFDSLGTSNAEEGNEEFSSSEDEYEYVKSAKRKKVSVFKKYTFTELKKWYDKDCSSTTYKLGKSEPPIENYLPRKIQGPPIVFIFEDFGRFNPAVIQDFILICSEYITYLPIVLMFGITTTVTAVHLMLPYYVSSKLSIQKFQSQPSLVCLTQVIDKVLITDRNAFKLGPHVFRLLYEHFLYHDFSINNFVRGLKFSVMQHFYDNLSSVMCSSKFSDITTYINDLRKTASIRNIASFQNYMEKKSESEQKKFISDDKLVKKKALELIRHLRAQETLFYPAVKCLCACTCNLPTHPLGKRLRDVYEYAAISTNIAREKRFDNAMSMVRMLSRDDLLPILQTCEEILLVEISSTKGNPLKESLKMLKQFIGQFENINKVTEEEETEKVEEEEEKKTDKKPMPVFKNRYEFTQNLKKIVKEKRKETPYEKLRNSIVDYFITMFRKYLQSPLSMPFHEIFYYNDVDTVRQRLNGTPRVAVQKALSNPHNYLQCSCCKGGDGNVIHEHMPDVCILYKLHLEGGKLINLYDWLQAFVAIADPSLAASNKAKSKRKKKLEEELQARFICGISELQFLGFIKSTARKTDHVARLTWGGC